MVTFSHNKTIIFRKRCDLWLCLFLIGIVWSVYSGVTNFDFINLDDTQYVTGNRHVQSGLTAENLFWSFRSTQSANWHPLTWLSHMVDVELYGLNAGGHHLTNVLFHIANTLLLFILLRRMIDTFWPSVFVAVLFAVHPLHVESVAWVAERKDLLSAFFGLFAIICYAGYVQRRSRSLYGLTLFCFMLSLMAKPMLVTLPFLMLLLDYWPLGRLKFNGTGLHPSDQTSSIFPLFFEKIPFFILTGISCVVTYYAQQSSGAVMPFELHPLGIRVANAVVVYMTYIGKMLWPAQLAVFYPYTDSFGFWQVSAAAAVLLGISIGVLIQIRQRPYLAVGWFWYIGMLVPVIGIVQVGGQAMADRYTYIPLIGLLIMIAWGTDEILVRWRLKRFFVALTAVILMLAIVAVSRIQVGHWANSITLFSHALEVTKGNYLAHLNLGKAFNDMGRGDEAFQHYSAAVHINPYSAPVHVNFGSALLAKGKLEEAADHFEHALKLDPNFAEAYNNLGLARVRRGHIEDAVYLFSIAVQKNPYYSNARQNLKLAVSIQQKINRAVKRMRQSLKIDLTESDMDLKMAELSENKRDLIKTVKNLQSALSRQPGFIRLEANNISAVSTAMKEYEDLLPLFLEVAKIQPAVADARYHVACIYARTGREPEAKKWLSLARAIDPKRWEFFKTDPDLMNL
jgi:tetratricopeptide (TPR) repeat protein